VQWWDRYGAEDARALLAANNAPAELALRVNTLVDFDEDELPPGRRDGDALVLDGPFDVAGSDLFARGVIHPQSRAAQLVAPAVDPQPGERVLDLCAAPGGKTTHLSALMANEGQVVAVEQHPGRAGALQRVADRLHATNVKIEVCRAQDYVAPRPFDRVLVDPPCSGLGTLRTHPDLRWRMTPELVRGLVKEQEAILSAARRALKPGGTLVYSTCTISAAEELVPGGTQTLPHRDGTDGFYVARTTL
jgi:16S rRNA (cytosine967-C5)-methyltransferase